MNKFLAFFIVAAIGIMGWSCTEDSSNEPGNTPITISFDSQGGNPVEAQTLKMGDRVKMPQEPSKSDGAKFQGWYTEPTGGEKFDFASYAVTESITLYAVWTPVFKVTFVYGNGSPDTELYIVQSGKIDKPVDPVFSGFEFKGWFTSGAAAEYDFNTPVTANLVLTVKWEELSPYATVTFYQNLNDQSTKKEIQVLKGSTVTPPADINPASLVPLKWYSDNACTKEFDVANTKINTSTSLWATWQLRDIDGNLYPITKLTFGEQGSWWSAANLKVTKFADGTPITLAQVPDEWGGAINAAHANYHKPLYCQVGYSWTPAAEMSARTALVGLQYNWYAAGSPKGLCPTGWHVPDYDEWSQLKTLPWPPSCMLAVAEEGAWIPASGTTAAEGSPGFDYTKNNSLKFNSRPSPMRGEWGYYADDNLVAKNEIRYWGRTDGDGQSDLGSAFFQSAHEPWLNVFAGGTGGGWSNKGQGYHVRCVKDN